MGSTVTPNCFELMVLMDAGTAPPGTHTAFFSLKTAAAVPCGPAATSLRPDDEHNTGSNFLLLFADVGITPTLLESLTEVDVPHIALDCRFALDIFTISQR